ncbi:MAG TPA: glycosyltransferase family 2 protein [Thermoplasmata archaeon]|nr:glycosyltransferase family 2 protein [Thermoplasmata archaeon]
MLAPLAVVVLAIATVVVLLYQGVALWFGAQMPSLRPDPPGTPLAGRPRVGVVIAARNEEADLPATLDALLRQDYPDLDIVVVDGGSTDGTRAAIEARAPRVRRLEEPPLPPGWTGKSWACWNGARAVDGSWLLFVDADLVLGPAAVRTLLGWAQRERADLASIGPKVEMVGVWERIVLPFFLQVAITYFRMPRANRAHAKSAFANGQCWLTPRATYDRLGGHRAVAAALNEDIAIARRYRADGRTLRVAWAPELGRTRMYRDRHEMFEGLLKNTGDPEFTPARELGILAGLVGLFWLPLGVLPLGIATGSLPVVGLGAILWFALFAKHVVFTRAVRGPPAYGLGFPIAVGFYVVLFATSLARKLRGRPVVWKGRSYPVA